MTQSGGRATDTGTAVRWALGSAITGVMAAAAVVLASVAPTAAVAAAPGLSAPGLPARDLSAPVVAPVAPAPLAAASPVTARPTPSTAPSTATSTATSTAPATTRPRAAADDDRSPARGTRASSSSGCGQRAVDAGRFDASCAEYQGYLDPGRAAGRGPSSGDLQFEYGCEQGYIPEDECG